MATPSRRLALRVLAEIDRGGPLLAERLAEPDVEALPSRDRAFLHELVLGTLRRRGSLDYALSHFLDQPFPRLPDAARQVLRLGAYQLLHLRVPDRAAVSESVDAARQSAPRLAGLVNAVLRRLAREGPPPWPDPTLDPLAWLTTEGSLPEWLARRWLAHLGSGAAVARARALLDPPAAVFRFNPRILDAEAKAHAAGLAWRPLHVPGAAAVIEGSPQLLAARGVLYLQDEGSQLVAHLAGGAGLRLDACAAPGGKTAVLADLAGENGRVVAAELSPRRLGTLKATIARWSCSNVRLVAADGLRPPFRCLFDAALLDAPCSGLGTLGRHPDIRWRAREAEIPRHAERQGALLRSLGPLVRKGGLLVYAVCSAEPEEGPEVVAAFRDAERGWEPADLPAWARPFATEKEPAVCRTRPEEHGGDAFYTAVLQRR